MKNKLFVYVGLTIFIIILLLITIFIYINFLDKYNEEISNSYKNDYVKLNDRPSYILKTVDNTLLTNYLGKEKTLVIFSATWCKYCLEEQDTLNSFILDNPDKTIIVVSHDTEYEDINKYLKENNFNWFVIYDTQKIIRKKIDPEGNKIPCAYILDKNGNVIRTELGVLTYEELKEFYEK